MDFTVTQPEPREAIEFPVNRDSQILNWDPLQKEVATESESYPVDVKSHT